MFCVFIYDVFSILFVLLVCIKYRNRLWQIPQPILVSTRTTVPLLVLRGLDTLVCPGLASIYTTSVSPDLIQDTSKKHTDIFPSHSASGLGVCMLPHLAHLKHVSGQLEKTLNELQVANTLNESKHTQLSWNEHNVNTEKIKIQQTK
jgi:hypothetical protein